MPGYGTQGGTARDVAAAFDENGLGALINNSRGITYAYERPAYHARFGGDWQSAIDQAVRDMIDDLAANTNAGRLRSESRSTTEAVDRAAPLGYARRVSKIRSQLRKQSSLGRRDGP